MPTRTNDATRRSIESELSATTIFELLANDRRQCALRYLTRAVGAVEVGELADHLALREGEHTRERYERICTSLVHIHVPKLTEAGVVQYDADRETLELLEPADQFEPYLDLAGPTDRR